MSGGAAAQHHMGDGCGCAPAPSPELVIGALPEQAVRGGWAGARGVAAGEDQRVGKQRCRWHPAEVHGCAVRSCCPGERRGREDEVGAADVEVTQLVERVFVEVGEGGRTSPGIA